jgi:putative hydrolase
VDRDQPVDRRNAEASAGPQKSADPVTVLRRIAFLLERQRAETYKVKAFRGAAAALLPLGQEEVRRRVEQGSLRELRGIGASTEKVVVETLRRGASSYLLALEEHAGPLATGGEWMRGLLRGDLHTHSDWSDGGSSIEEMAMTAVQVGHEYVALTDHSPRLKVANGLTVERLARQLDVVAAVNEQLGGSLRMLTGIEVDIHEDGSLDQDEELLDRLDVVVASVHSKLRMEREAMTRRMVAAVEQRHSDVLGHCTGRLVTGGRGTRPPSTFDAERVFTACAAHDVAVEINSRPERVDPPDDLVALALEVGCLFTVDSDAHAPGQLDFLDYGCSRAAELGVPAERIVNTWPVDRLLEWSRR